MRGGRGRRPRVRARGGGERREGERQGLRPGPRPRLAGATSSAPSALEGAESIKFEVYYFLCLQKGTKMYFSLIFLQL